MSGSSYSHDLYLPDYRFGDAGAYEELPDLTADWSNLEQASTPFVFGGGWESGFDQPYTIVATVGADQTAIQQSVERSELYNESTATPIAQQEYEAELEVACQAEAERQADLAGSAPGSLEADLAAVNMNGRRERAIERYYQFADGMASMTPGVNVIHDAHQLYTGQNTITGEELTGFDKAIAGVSLVASFFPGAGLVDDTFQTAGKTARVSGKMAKAGDGIAGGVKVSKNGKRIDAATDAVKAVPNRGLRLADNPLGQVDNVMLERIRLGAQIDVPAGTQGIRKTMSDLSVVSGNEVALMRMESGRRLIVMGGPNTIALPPRTARIIAHTHPQGSLRFSAPDIRALTARGQRSSVLISPREDFGIRLPVPPLGN